MNPHHPLKRSAIHLTLIVSPAIGHVTDFVTDGAGGGGSGGERGGIEELLVLLTWTTV